MDAEYANYYTREVMLILIREFQSPDEEMKKIVLKVLVPDCSIFTNLNWMCFIVEREFYIIKKYILDQDCVCCCYYYFFEHFRW